MKTFYKLGWGIAVMLLAISITPVLGIGKNATLSVNARNDKPGPVQVRVEGWDIRGNLVVDTVLSWAANDNGWSIQAINIPKNTRVLRLTFINDFFVPNQGPDYDRNANIDYFMVNNLLYEAEDWDRTGGPDPVYPGAGVETVDGRVTAGCGNQGDWVEYDLHPGNPMGPAPGPGKRIGPTH